MAGAHAGCLTHNTLARCPVIDVLVFAGSALALALGLYLWRASRAPEGQSPPLTAGTESAENDELSALTDFDLEMERLNRRVNITERPTPSEWEPPAR